MCQAMSVFLHEHSVNFATEVVRFLSRPGFSSLESYDWSLCHGGLPQPDPLALSCEELSSTQNDGAGHSYGLEDKD